MFDLHGKMALVTGGSRGLGAGVVRALAECGANVAVNYVRAEDKAKEVAEYARGRGVRALIVQADVGKEPDVKKMFEAVMKEFGRLDILVNNAGIYVLAEIEDTTLEMWNTTIECNLTSTFLCTKLAVGIMKRQKSGRIINMSSVNGSMGTPTGTVHYAATKAGQIAMAKSLATNLAPYHITVNCVAPGIIYTDMTPLAIPSEEKRIQYERSIPMGFGKVEDVGAAVAYLASDEAGYVTGATIDVNGGRYYR